VIASTDGTTARVRPFDLTRFFPYRLALIADRVSQAVAQVYADRFDLSRAEWRILAGLGANGEMAASELGHYSTLDKMQVSRAVARLAEAGLVRRVEDADDRRSKRLSLTPAGSALLAKITPLVAARESYLLETLSREERDTLERALDIILSRAEGLVSRG
jgi:DNA-binding MarR family transcriptional regulator